MDVGLDWRPATSVYSMIVVDIPSFIALGRP